MIPYLAFYLFLSIKSIAGSQRLTIISYLLLIAFFCFFVGFRYEIGVDWDQYVAIVEVFRDEPISKIFSHVEPGYMLLSWIGSNFKNGIYIVI